jgi:hypothetical protein
MKKNVVALSIATLGVFGIKTSYSSNNSASVPESSLMVNVEIQEMEAFMSPIVKKGDAGMAAVASNNNRLAIHVTGRNGGNMSAKDYAVALANAFADRRYTDKPMRITVTYNNRDQAGDTFATIYMDGGRYKTKEGIQAFMPEQILEAIQLICDIHVARHGNNHIIESFGFELINNLD